MPIQRLPPLASVFLAQKSEEPAVDRADLLREMIALSHSRQHALAIYAFNVATTPEGVRAAVRQFYDVRDVPPVDPTSEPI